MLSLLNFLVKYKMVLIVCGLFMFFCVIKGVNWIVVFLGLIVWLMLVMICSVNFVLFLILLLYLLVCLFDVCFRNWFIK